MHSTASSPRKGIVGDHKAHFTDKDYEFIQDNLKSLENQNNEKVKLETAKKD